MVHFSVMKILINQSSAVTKVQLYAAYGEALYLAQSLEIGMRIFYSLDQALPTKPPGKVPRIDFDEEPLPDASANSLGGFIRQFRTELLAEGTLDTQTRSLMRKLENAVVDRNWLVHTYWWDRLAEAGTPQGRATMLAELNELIALFRQYNEMIRRMVLFCLSHHDLTPAQIDSPRLHNYLASVEALPGATDGA
jgi:hypothetical protein